MRDQPVALLTAMEGDRVSIRILPGDITVMAGLGGGFVIAGIEGGADTVYVESAAEGTVTDRPGDVAEIRTGYVELSAEAQPTRRASTSQRR